MWTLVFVFSFTIYNNSPVAPIVIPNFRTKEACMIAQKALIDQATQRNEVVRINMCVKGE